MIFPRVTVIVLDSVGIGALPDAAAYHDEGSNTLGNIARAVRGERIGTLVSTPDWAEAGSGQEGMVQP